MNAPITTPKEALYLELGVIPPSTIIKIKRVNYLHYLLIKEQTEMLSKFFWAQFRNPLKGDWALTVLDDLKDFGITTDLEQISTLSKNSFKQMVKVRAKKFTFSNLLSRKLEHSKLTNLVYSEFGLQSYFRLQNFTVTDIRTLFMFRVRMTPFWGNFRGNEVSRLCSMCNSHPDTQQLFPLCYKVKSQFSDCTETVNNIYSEKLTVNNAEKLVKMLNFRENLIGKSKN